MGKWTFSTSGVNSANAIAVLEELLIVVEVIFVIVFWMQALFEVKFFCGVDLFVVFKNLILDLS